MFKPRFYCVLLVLFALASLPAAAETDEELAMRFYPADLDAFFYRNHLPGTVAPRLTTLLRVDLDRTGRADYLAVAYSNGLAAELKLIRGVGAEAAVVAVGEDETLGGRGTPTLDAADFENDGVPELIVGFSRANWIFKYRNGALVLFGPSRQGTVGVTTDLTDAAFLDIDGDGVLEILEVSIEAGAYVVHKLGADGKFTRTATSVGFTDVFQRSDEEPEEEQRVFTATPGKYILRITNGDQSKKSMVTAGEIRLNGKTVVGSQELRKGTALLSIPVTLPETNELSVILRSDPDSYLHVSFIRQ